MKIQQFYAALTGLCDKIFPFQFPDLAADCLRPQMYARRYLFEPHDDCIRLRVLALPQQEARPNPNWSEETKAYYNKLLTQETLDFGVFTYSMVHSTSSHYTTNTNGLRSEKARLEEAERLAGEGKTPLFFALGGQALGLMSEKELSSRSRMLTSLRAETVSTESRCFSLRTSIL